ncbi:uncharacterized protein K452DRAFT_301838 [Aplosporella prunicola CBS 121167]|uniref:SnoaL-like domain-containing protein n=1 Tax=Aplosporella prunicola CBS 121167 TaxID=1176127 RepID=A0A6A6B368_9PEZI|nr:uncharacterized protein K452DRAFT_301838 [Aplosporella prunicola CBS 121167]KAF2137664.1 hypothetical protein K452DRAFT_301838 [Aplosporella prunicola CBS 121167]
MSTGYLKISTANMKTGPGVELLSDQKVIVSSVLDLFAGRASQRKLNLWSDDAVFEDPLTQVRGRKEFESQWYGLQTAFSQIERLSYEVTSSGNPITMELKTRYIVKGAKSSTTIKSVVSIYTDSTGQITKVEDKWNDEVADSTIVNAFRRLNAVSIPSLVSVPKDIENEMRRGN